MVYTYRMDFEKIKIIPRDETRAEKPAPERANEIWNEAEGSATIRHGEGLKTALDIALQHRDARNNQDVRNEIFKIYEQAKKRV